MTAWKQQWTSLSWSLSTHQTKEAPGSIYIITFLLQCSGNHIYFCQLCRVKFKVLSGYSLGVQLLCGSLLEPTVPLPAHYPILLWTGRGTGQGWQQTWAAGEELTIQRGSIACSKLRSPESKEGKVLTNMRCLQSDFPHITRFTMKKIRIENMYFSIATWMSD